MTISKRSVVIGDQVSQCGLVGVFRCAKWRGEREGALEHAIATVANASVPANRDSRASWLWDAGPGILDSA